MSSLNTIIVGVDFSDCSRTALNHAKRLAISQQAQLHVVHVIPSLVIEDLAAAVHESVDSISRESVDRASREIWSWLDINEFSVEPIVSVQIGKPLAIIVNVVEQSNADLLVLGVYGSSARKGDSSTNHGAGTFASKCVRKVPTKVMLIEPSHAGAFSKIVACVDFSKTSLRAVEHAARIAHHDQSKLIVLHVFDPPWNKLHYRAPTRESSPEFQMEYRTLLQGRLEDFVAPVLEQFSGLDANITLADYSSYGHGIVEFAQQQSADLVAIGTEGNTNLRYMFLGSTAERVLRETKCSVLTVKPERFSMGG